MHIRIEVYNDDDCVSERMDLDDSFKKFKSFTIMLMVKGFMSQITDEVKK
jgi:hypothetical protein